MSPIRILIVDDHELVRQGLSVLLSSDPGFQVIGSADSVAAGIRFAREAHPDVLLLDIAMPDGSGLDALPAFRATSADTAILMLSMYDEPEIAQRALQLGAMGLIPKTCSPDELCEAIRQAARGDKTPASTRLTPRERDILSLLCLGKDNLEIAEHLSLRPRSIENRIQGLMSKLNIRTRTGLIAHARRVGARTLIEGEAETIAGQDLADASRTPPTD
ncbi:response regulator transcription factor [Candidatus Bipolaricaulota bacterium]|nr:response regulator transcription factor [Candidatus Bipolaricaulota bacterium]